MQCPNCLFDKWDGKSPHLYGGRESAGMQCFGPRVLKPRPVGAKPVAAAQAPTGEQSKDQQAQVLEHPDPPKKEKKLTRAEKVAQKFAALGIRLGSEIDPPNPAARPTKPSRRASGRTRLAPKRTT